ncbi:hypothetical protein WR25_14091 [Diploscapter pachys]|uniref:Peptidase M12A domain-containing protein n=1 Tax=Diploscapter pachys TaxID=2018661 RepID=A0A2A2K7Z3_9BILA|nr:hypothetical protein WR25_14091 [Diploscapter pachys]
MLIPYFLLTSSFPIILGKHENLAERNFLRGDSHDSLENRQAVKNILKNIELNEQKQNNAKKMRDMPIIQNSPNPISVPVKNETKGLQELNAKVADLLFQTDMALNIEQAKAIAGGATSRARRSATTDSKYYWDKNTPIYYEFDKALDSSSVASIRKAIEFWHENTCLNFQENPNGQNKLHFYSGSGCWSYVGKQYMWPKQDSRYDRDDYIQIVPSNIPPAQQYNFVKMTPETETHFGRPYDLGSDAFAIDPSKPTIIARNPLFQDTMGQRDQPAFSDVIMVNQLYNCSGDRCEELAQGDAQGCNGKTIDATETEQNFTIAIGDPTNYDVKGPAQNCYWIIRAPKGEKVTMSLSLDSIACVKQCPWRGIEINTGRFDLVGFRMTNDVSSVSDSSKSIKSSTLVPLPQMMDSVESAPAASFAAADEPEPEPVEHVYQMYISARPKRGTRRVNFASNSSDSSVQISMPFCSYFIPPSKFPDLVPLSSSEYYFVGSTDGQNDRRRRVRRSKASTVAMTGLRGTIQKKFPVHRSSRIETYGPKRPNGEERRNERRKKNGKRKKTAVEQIDNEERQDIKTVAEEHEMDQKYPIPKEVRFFRDQ